MNDFFYHQPVLVEAVLAGLKVASGDTVVDATAGGGGHTAAFLAAGARVIALDADGDAVRQLEKRFGKNIAGLTLIRGNFRNLAGLVSRNGPAPKISGIIFDLGVSSFQLDRPEKGFTYREDGAPLDMRLDDRQETDARTILNKLPLEELYEIIAQYGEEKHARAISRAIGRARQVKPLTSAGDLKQVIGQNDWQTLARVFQAIRIRVNDELGALREGLEAAYGLLTDGGRVAVISYHSLEDRIAKLEFRKERWQLVTAKPIRPKDAEISLNPRSRSAKLRIAAKKPVL